MTFKILIAIALVLLIILILTSCYGTRKIVLSENRVHHWKVYWVTTRHLSVGTYQHAEVYYKGKLLVLPKEVTDGKREVSEFVTAAAIDNRSGHFGTVAVIFEGEFIRDDGVPYRALVTLHVRPGKGNELIVINPCNGSEAIMDPA